MNTCKFYITLIMSVTLSISGYSASLTTNFSPALQLDGDYECGLLHFSTFNSIPNVSKNNSKFHYGKDQVIDIPEGSYELQDINDYLKKNIKNCTLNLSCNNNTLKSTVFCSQEIHFEKENSIGEILGFGKEVLKPSILHESRFPVSILSTTVIRVECDIVSGSFINEKPSHILHEFSPNVPPGYKIIEVPKNIIYFPINQNIISSVNIRILDSKNRLVNLRQEEVLLYLHIKKK